MGVAVAVAVEGDEKRKRAWVISGGALLVSPASERGEGRAGVGKGVNGIVNTDGSERGQRETEQPDEDVDASDRSREGDGERGGWSSMFCRSVGRDTESLTGGTGPGLKDDGPAGIRRASLEEQQ